MKKKMCKKIGRGISFLKFANFPRGLNKRHEMV